MKKTGQCPKCSSSQVVQLAGQVFSTKVYPRSSYGNISDVEKYACTDCGYVETYLVEQAELDGLKDSQD